MKKKFLLIALAITSSLSFAQSTKGSFALSYTTKDRQVDSIIKNLSVAQADSLINANTSNPNFVIIDVRTSSEFNGSVGHIANAINIDYYAANFGALIDTLNKNKMYLVYCGSGTRSAKARDTMRVKHFAEVYNMLGGITAWKNAGYPVVITTFLSELNSTEMNTTVYPNPVSDISTIEFNGIFNTPVTVDIYDMFGRKIKCIFLNNNENKFTIDRDQFISGIYLYHIISDNKALFSGKFEIE